MCNFDSDLEKLQSVARLRDNPSHNILGRILVVKSLMFPKLLYKFKAIESPPAFLV